MNRHRVAVLSAAVASLVTLIAAQPVVAAQPTPASGDTWAPNQRVEYRWKEGAEPPAWAKSAMNAAAADSNSSRRAKAAVFSQRDGAAGWLAYTDDLPTNWAIGYTVRGIPDWFSIRLRPQGTQLDWGTLRWCQFYDDPPNGCYDAEMVMLHEFGHAQTLGHVNEADNYEWMDTVLHENVHSKPKLGWNTHVFGPCDVARLQIRYEPLNTSTPISTCLDLPSDLSLSSSSANVAYGDSVTLTAKLKIGSDAVYPLLANEPLSGRSVILQRRSVNASTWTTVGDMNAVTDATGRYVKSVAVTATYHWRAVFSSPSGEGLDGSTSATVRVSSTWTCTPNGAPANVPLYETC